MVIDYQSPARAFVGTDPDTELASERLARQIMLFDINARQRAERAKSGRMTLWLAIGTLVPFLAVAAIAGPGNWKETRISNVQP